MFTHHTVALPSKKRAIRGRRLVVVDIENVVEGAVMTMKQAVDARASVDAAVGLRKDDHVVIGTSHIGVLATGLGWAGSPRIVVRSGANGADLALIEVLTSERVEDRFEEVVLVSGDGIFVDVVAALGAAGVRVTVAARSEAFSAKLRLAAACSVHLASSVVEMGDVA